MNSKTTLVSGRTCFGIIAVLIVWFSVSPRGAIAQSAGQNGVYDSSGACSPCAASSAFIDASMFASKVSSPNFCSVLGYILNPANHVLTSAGAVIDARGLLSSTPPTSMTCTASPWAGITSPLPATILLPAGTIVIPSGWVLPLSTRLIGVGNGDVANSSGASYSGTTIQACKSGKAAVGALSLAR
jgi:hypothetical protein